MWWWRSSFCGIVAILVFLTVGIPGAKAQREIQEDQEVPLKDRMFFGGNFAVSFGTITFVDISPLAGVMITNRFSAGAGITYQYFRDSRFIGGANNIYGGRVFGRYNVRPNIFLHGEYEQLNLDLFNPRTETFSRTWVPGLFLGGGYFSPFGSRGGLNFTFLYNLLYDVQRSPYNRPYVIRFGFVF